jgi:hypothetical protein
MAQFEHFLSPFEKKKNNFAIWKKNFAIRYTFQASLNYVANDTEWNFN